MISNKELDQALLDSVIELKPPSKIKEVIMWFTLGFLGGVGLGVLICFLR